ncbi:hypothetical protein BH23CHL4_BH23CHL4_22720 [soil metagenome]
MRRLCLVITLIALMASQFGSGGAAARFHNWA